MSTRLQAKLNTTSTSAPFSTLARAEVLQRKWTRGKTASLVTARDEDRQKWSILQRRGINEAEPATMPPIVNEVLRSLGQPLARDTRAFMEPRFGHDFSRVSVHTTAPMMIQPKLTISQPGDKYEQEADRVAEQVMRMPEPNAMGKTQIFEDRIPSPRNLQCISASRAETTTEAPIVNEVLRSSGQPLDTATRAYMETRFGHDFSQVRVHTDGKATESAWAVNACAFAVGHDLVFGAGQYTPETSGGKRLLAHELTHTIQQRGAAVRPQGRRLFFRPHAPGPVQAFTQVAERPGAPPAMWPNPGPVLRNSAEQLMRTPDDLTEAASYPTEAEREEILGILDPQQQAAAQAGGSVDPVNPNGFRRDMTARMNSYIGQVLPRAQARQASSVTLGRTEILDLGDIVQPEVENFYGTYLTAATHSSAEARRRAGYQLRTHLHLVSDVLANVDDIACDWVVSRMLYRGADLMRSYHVLASGATAKRSCPPGSPSTASGAANERDQDLFESVRDEVFNAHQAGIQTIILFQSSFEGAGETYIQSHIRPRSWESAEETERRGRWETLGTIIHEMLHAVAHEDFDQAVGNIEEVDIAKEGFTEYFARPVYNALRTRATGAAADGALRTSIEGIQAPPDSNLAPDRRGYQPYVDQVIEIKDILGGNEESLKVAYFMGHVEYIGLGGWNEQEASRRRYPANQLGVAALLIPSDIEGLVRVDYGRVMFGRGGAFQVTLGGTINYLTDGDRLGLCGTVGLQYSWPNVYVRGRVGVGASVSPGQPFEESVRLDVLPDVEVGVRIGVVRIGAGATLLIPVTGGPIDERVIRIAPHVGLSLDL